MACKYYLSVDCGGTKTAFLVTDQIGNFIAYRKGPPANYIVNGLEPVARMLKDFIGQIQSQELNGKPIDTSFIALAGFGDVPSENEQVIKKITESLDLNRILVGNDTENAIAGSLLGQSGIHIISGTGSIGIGIDSEGKTIRSGGWHHLFGGDEGSGYWIGCNRLQHFTKQADGREEKTLLFDLVMEKMNLNTPEEVLKIVIEQWNGDRDKIASLSRLVSEGAIKGDKNCQHIFEEAARELALIASAIGKQGNFSEPIQVSYSGGVFQSGELILKPLKSLLSPEFSLVKPALGPQTGGIVKCLVFNEEPISTQVIENLKETEKHFI